MNKYKYLAKNVGLLTVSKFGTSILTFFLVPLYTSILTTEEYGNYELISTTVNLLIPILTVNIAVAVFRFSVDDNEHWADTFSTGIKHLLIGSAILLLLLALNYVFKLYRPFKTYSLYILLLFVSSSLSEIEAHFARGQEKIKEIAVSGVLGTGSMILFNILFLVILKFGIDGYFWAMIISHVIPTVYLWITCKSRDYLIINPSVDISREMTAFSTPMIANAIGWWINNVSDRYIVTFICGIAANGVYSVAYKIPSILTILQTIFSQAWTLSAVKDYDEKDRGGFFEKVYILYNFINVIGCSILIALVRMIAGLLFQKDFYFAWRYVPFLLISVVFGALSGYFGSIYSAVKQSKMFAKSTVIGAIVNTILNVVFIHLIGPLGAAIATAISYFIVYVIRLVDSRKYITFRINLLRDGFAYLVLVFQAVLVNLTDGGVFNLAGQLLAIVIILVLFLSEIKMILHDGFIFLGRRKYSA